MTERNFSVPEGRDESGITFIRASKLSEELELSAEDNLVVLEGVFQSSQPNSMNEDKLDYKFTLDDESEVVINGAGNLGYKMKFINAGDYAQIIYYGKKEIAKGPQKGRMAHDFEVLTAED